MGMQSMQEKSERQLLEMLWRDGAPFAVYIYTPWCGTCKWGEKMLSVALTIEPDAAVYKSDINYLPTLIKEWKIESVPCLAFVEGKRVKEKLYRMTSTDFLLAQIRERLI